MIISCPHCQTKYQVTFEAIGSAGRKVQCAQCRRAWDQQPIAPEPEPDDDRLFDAMEEDALDEILMAEAKSVAAETRPNPKPIATAQAPLPAPAPDAAEMRKRQDAFSRRQSVVVSRLPLARLRRAARLSGLVLVVSIIAAAYFWRAPIVERYPDLAGIYEAVGLGVNVVGLDFADPKTLKTLANGKDVLLVSGRAGQKMKRARLNGKGQILEDLRTIAIAQAHIGKLDQERVLPVHTGGVATPRRISIGGIIAATRVPCGTGKLCAGESGTILVMLRV